MTEPQMTRRSHEDLRDALLRLDGKGYKAYKDIKGVWGFPRFTLLVDHVQGDPFAAPSRVRVRVPAKVTGLPEEVCRAGPRAVGTACLLARRFQAEARDRQGSAGSGRSGEIRIDAPGQEVIPNTAASVSPDGAVEARFRVGLPARGRRILGRAAVGLLLEAVPALVERSLLASAHDPEDLELHARTNEEADTLRSALDDRGLVAFVADGALLPRRSGVDDRPLDPEETVPFRSPDAMRVRLPLHGTGSGAGAGGEPDGGSAHDDPGEDRGTGEPVGEVVGMGIPRGVTLIVGGGYHGKSTLLRALERGVYNHRPGDGRERVVTDPGAVKIRAEDGRSVQGVDISPFIGELPGGTDTRRFSTGNASGSTSQAAAIMEAVEAGASALLIDEDTAATNFMIRDRRMQALVPRDREPITPFIDRVRELNDALDISSILVLGGSGDYLDIADRVIAMTEFLPADVTDEAREVARRHPTGRRAETPGPLGESTPRRPMQESVDPSRGRREVSVKVRGEASIQMGTDEIDLSAVEQLVSWPQTRAVSEGILLAWERFLDGERSLPGVLDEVMRTIDEEGLDVLGHGHDGDLARFRRFELAAALNRLRTLRVR